MTNMKTYEEFVSNCKKDSCFKKVGNNRIGSQRPKRPIKKSETRKDVDKINEVTKMTHKNGRFTFTSDNKKEIGKDLSDKKNKKNKIKGKKIKDVIIKNFTNFR